MTTIVQSQPWPRTDDAIRALLDSGEPAVLRDGPVVGVDADSVAARLGRMLLQTNSDGIFPFVVERQPLDDAEPASMVERFETTIELLSRDELQAVNFSRRKKSAVRDGDPPQQRLYASGSVLVLRGAAAPNASNATEALPMPGPPPARDEEVLADLGAGALLEVARELHAASGSNETIANAWLSSRGAVTPLHYDERHLFFAQLSGRKSFVLHPPDTLEAQRVFPHTSAGRRQSQFRYAQLRGDESLAADEGGGDDQGGDGDGDGGDGDGDGERPARRKAPKLPNGRRTAVKQQEWLYVPPYWSHEVKTVSAQSLSTSVWAHSAERAAAACLRSIDPPWQPHWVVRDRIGVVFLIVQAIEQRLFFPDRGSTDLVISERQKYWTPVVKLLRSRFNVSFGGTAPPKDPKTVCGTGQDHRQLRRLWPVDPSKLMHTAGDDFAGPVERTFVGIDGKTHTFTDHEVDDRVMWEDGEGGKPDARARAKEVLNGYVAGVARCINKEAYKDLQGGKKLQGVEVLHSLLADHAERLLVWALGGATVKAARLAKMIPVIVLHCLKGHHEDPVEEEPPKPRKPRKSTFQQLPR